MLKQPSITFQELTLNPAEAEVNSVLLTIYAEKKGLPNGFNEVFSRIKASIGDLLLKDYLSGAGEHIYEAKDTDKVAENGFKELFIIKFEPQLTTDTLAVQIIINAKEAADIFWPKTAAWLRTVLQSWLVPLKHTSLLGYTLVYRANITEEQAFVSDQLSPLVVSKLSTIVSDQAFERGSTIKTMLIPDQGLIYLVDTPHEEDPALVYVALGIKGRTLDIATRSLAGWRGMLPNMDVFVHKSLTQWLSLEKCREQYEKKLEELNQHVGELLAAIGKPNPSPINLLRIADDFSNIEKTFWQMERMELSLQQSINGIKRLFQQQEVNEVAAVHLRGLREKVEEVRYLINKSSLTVDTTRTALQMMEAQQREQANEQRRLGDDRQLSFNNFFVFLGIVLTLMQVLDEKIIEELLKHYTICPPSTLMKIIIRLIASLSLAGLIWMIVSRYLKRRDI